MLTALVSIAVINAVRISLNVSSVQTSIAAVEPLAGYPVSARYDRRTANVVVEGLVPDAASAGLLETTLQARHPRLSLHFVLSNITTDAVRPSLRTARVEREANSVSVASLRDAGSIRDAMIMDLEARVRALQAELRAARAQSAAASFPAVTYDLDPDLSAERDRVGALLVEGRLLEGLIAPVSAEDGFEMLDGAGAAARRAEISPEAMEVVSAMLVGFDRRGELYGYPTGQRRHGGAGAGAGGAAPRRPAGTAGRRPSGGGRRHTPTTLASSWGQRCGRC